MPKSHGFDSIGGLYGPEYAMTDLSSSNSLADVASLEPAEDEQSQDSSLDTATPSVVLGSSHTRLANHHPDLDESSLQESKEHTENDNSYRGPATSFAQMNFTLHRPPIAHRSLSQRIGAYLICMNVGAMILLVISISVLSFVWFGGDTNAHWRRVMINGWIAQSVTLSALAIRLAVSIQAGTATAMLASISMESLQHGGVVLSEAPALSIARYLNSGPVTSLPMLLRNAWLTRRRLIPLFGLILALTTLISQFTSTLLLWDVGAGVTDGFPETTYTGVGIAMEGFTKNFETRMRRARNYWSSSQQFLPAFAEWSGRSQPLSKSVVDTGPTVRVFLPLASELDRSMLQEFTGKASAFDARVACFKPLLSNWSIEATSANRIILKGYVRPENVTNDLRQVLLYNQTDPDMDFRCIYDDLETLAEPIFKICGLSSAGGGLMSSLNPTTNTTLSYSYDASTDDKGWIASNNLSNQSWKVDVGHTFLIIQSYKDISDPHRSTYMTEDRGVWVDILLPYLEPFTHSNITTRTSMTLCYDALLVSDYIRNIIGLAKISYDRPNSRGRYGRLKHTQEFSVHATRSSNHSEAGLLWDSQAKAYNTTAVRVQLGATNDTTPSRNVFELDYTHIASSLYTMAQQWSPDQNISFIDLEHYSLWYLNSTTRISFPSSGSGSPNYATLATFFDTYNYPTTETYDFLNSLVWQPLNNTNRFYEIHAPCLACNPTVQGIFHDYPEDTNALTLHEMPNAIFRDIILHTGNPAIAWQALITVVLSTTYHDWVTMFDKKENITTVSTVPCLLPLYSKGFIISIANICLHLVLMSSITVWFATETEYSLLNRSWQVMAQLEAPATEKLMQDSTMVDDKTIRRRIEANAQPRRRLWVRKTFDGERVCLS